jgi:4-hydroxybenzoyl-CoA reductase subunit alpha
MGLSETVAEQVLFDDKGKLINPDLANYRILTAKDMCKFDNYVVDATDEVAGPWGVKEVGEGANNPTMGAVRNAIMDAAGVSISTLPITAEKVWRALKEKKAAEAK